MAEQTLDSSLNNPTNTQYPPYQSQTTSAFKPMPLRSSFTPSQSTLDIMHHPDSISNKLDQLLVHNTTTDTNFVNLRAEIASFRSQVEIVPALKQENIKIKQHLSVALGKINRLEHQKEEHHQKMVKLEQFSFAKDIVIYNMRESNPESVLDLRNKVYELFHSGMQIPKANLFHPLNPRGK